MRKLLMLSSIFLLISCATKEQRDAAEMAQCTELGFKKNTNEFANCRLQIKSIQAQQQAAQAAHVAAGAAIMNNRPKTCTPVGNSIQCY